MVTELVINGRLINDRLYHLKNLFPVDILAQGLIEVCKHVRLSLLSSRVIDLRNWSNKQVFEAGRKKQMLGVGRLFLVWRI